MRSGPFVFFSYCALVLVVLLYMSKPTDADLLDREVVEKNRLTALTLDLNDLDTANETQKSLLFSVQSMIPGGFSVESVRFKNSGTQTMEYQLGFQQTAGDATACQALHVKVLRNWSVVLDTALTTLTLADTLKPDEKNDVVLAIQLDTNDAQLRNLSCVFNLVVKAKAKDVQGSVVFSDEEILQNQVGLGTWSGN